MTQPTAAADTAEFHPGDLMQLLRHGFVTLPNGEGEPPESLRSGGETELPPPLFMATVEQAPVAISITDSQARILYVNRLFEELTGYRREEVVGQNQSILSSRSTPEAVYRDLWRTIQQRQVWRGHLVNFRKDGTDYLADLTISPVLNQEGTIGYYLGMHHDITALHQLEAQLQFQKRLNEAALDAAPMAVAMLDSERQLLLKNRAYQRLALEFSGQDLARLLLHALTQQIGLDFSPESGMQEPFTHCEVRLEIAGEGAPRWFSCSGVRIDRWSPEASDYFRRHRDQRCALLLIAHEISDSRQQTQEAQLNFLRTTMAEHQLIQSMRETLTGALYRLQLPLNRLRAALAVPPEASFNLRQSVEEALQLSEEAVAGVMQAVPVLPREQSSALNLNAILYEVLRLSIDRLLANGIVVDWQPSPSLPLIQGQPNALRSLFKYLIDNAIQALHESNPLQRELHLTSQILEGEVAVEVSDNGRGVAEADRFRIFEPFWRGWQQPKGHAGMGLAMAQEICSDHHATLLLDTEFRGGARFRVTLPILAAE